jgi:hypothetical protein
VQRPRGGFPAMTVSDTQDMRDYFGKDAMRLLTLSHEMQHQIDHENRQQQQNAHANVSDTRVIRSKGSIRK